MEKAEIKQIGAYFKKLSEGLLWGDYDDKALEAELEQIQGIITALDNVNLKPKDQWLKTEADRCERGIDEILSRTFSLQFVDEAEHKPFLKQVANDVNTLLIQNRTTFEQHSNEYHKELTESIKARKQRWQKINKYREKSFKNKILRNKKAGPPKKGWVWYDDSLLKNGVPNCGFWMPPCKIIGPTDPGLKLLPIETGRRHYATGIPPKNREEELHKYFLLLTIIHDWLLPSCVPIDKDTSQHRLATQVHIISLNLLDEGQYIIKRALEHVEADLAGKIPAAIVQVIKPDEEPQKEHEDFLLKIAKEIHDLITRIPSNKKCFQAQASTFNKKCNKNDEALKEHLKNAEDHPEWKVYGEGKPPSGDWIYDGSFKIWRPNPPFDPWDWLVYYYANTSLPQFPMDRPKEPKAGERLMCQYVVLGIVYDEKYSLPSCDRLCKMLQSDSYTVFWESLVSLLLSEKSRDTMESRVTKALEDVKTDLARKKAEETKNIEQQEKDGQNDDIAIDDKELTIIVELSEGSDKTYSQVEIEAATNIPRGTIKDKLLRLETIELVHRPLGKRKGYQITDKGREIVKRNE